MLGKVGGEGQPIYIIKITTLISTPGGMCKVQNFEACIVEVLAIGTKPEHETL